MKIQQTLWLLLLCCLSLTVQANNPTLKQLVKDADLIIIGKLYKVAESGQFYGYQVNSQQLAAISEQSLLPFGIPYTDYLVKANKILKANAHAVASNQILVRMLFDHVKDLKKANQRLQQKGTRRQVFFLAFNPDRLTYSVMGRVGIMEFKKLKKNDAIADNITAAAAITEQLVYYDQQGKQKSLFTPHQTANNALTEIEQLAQILDFGQRRLPVE